MQEKKINRRKEMHQEKMSMLERLTLAVERNK
jgi:hypothetical protein